jgi:hypothetical protein
VSKTAALAGCFGGWDFQQGGVTRCKFFKKIIAWKGTIDIFRVRFES